MPASTLRWALAVALAGLMDSAHGANDWQTYGKPLSGFIQGGARYYTQYRAYRSPLTPPFGTAVEGSLGVYVAKDFGIFGTAAKGVHYPMTEMSAGGMMLFRWFGFGGSSGVFRRFAPQLTVSVAKMHFDSSQAPYAYRQDHTVPRLGGSLFIFLGDGREFLSFSVTGFRLSSSWFVAPSAGYGLRW